MLTADQSVGSGGGDSDVRFYVKQVMQGKMNGAPKEMKSVKFTMKRTH